MKTCTTAIVIINSLATMAAATNTNTFFPKLLAVPANINQEDALDLAYDNEQGQAAPIYSTVLQPQERPTREVIEALIDMGHKLLDNHMLEDAYKVFEEALFMQKNLRTMQQLQSSNDEEIAATLKAIARVRTAMGDYDGAFDTLNEALELQIDHQSIADTLFDAGLVLMDGAYFDDALRVFKESITVQILVDGYSSSRIAEVQDYMGETFLRTNQLDEAINAWSDSADMWKVLNEDGRLADSLNSMGVAYFRSGDYDVASIMYQEAMSIYSNNTESYDKMDVARKNLDLVTDLASTHEECIAVYHVNGKMNQTGTIEC